MSNHRLLAALLAVTLALPACADHDPTAIDSGARAFATSGIGAGPAQLTGELAGTQYSLHVPAGWNGDLVVYAHGFIDPAMPIALPTADGFTAIRDGLLERGVAVAYSSFGENGFAVKDGAQATHQLTGIFTAQFGTPARVFLVGHSLGALISLDLAERFPAQYAGALAICGPLAGTRATLDYIGNTRAVFDFFYPGVVPGTVLDLPPVNLNTQVVGPVIAAISASPTPAMMIAQLAQTPVPFASGPELVESFVRVIGYNFRGLGDMLARTHGRSPFDNTLTTYSGALPPTSLAAINTGVDRYAATPDALAYIEQYYEPTGELQIPLLTLHNVRDPVAPLFHEVQLAALVDAAGASQQLVQRTVNRYGHCAITTDETLAAFADLVGWGTTGVQPLP
jgi:pimeloyl-ACP methyl ester carboxylesterase